MPASGLAIGKGLQREGQRLLKSLSVGRLSRRPPPKGERRTAFALDPPDPLSPQNDRNDPAGRSVEVRFEHAVN